MQFGTFDSEYIPLVGSARDPKYVRYAYGAVGLFVICGLMITFSGSEAPAAAVEFAAPIEDVSGLTDGTPAPVALDEVVSESFTVGQYNLIYNFLSFSIAAMGSSTVFFFFQFSLVKEQYRTAIVISALVVLIAFYHYIRIFNSFTEAYTLMDNVVTETGIPFNNAYRYVDWLLTVPLLLMEIVLIMNLSEEETASKIKQLGISSALMICLGYPGEISDSMMTRWFFWGLAMIFFLFIVYSLTAGLQGSLKSQGSARSLVETACYVTIISWCTYPIVYIFPMLGLTGYTAMTFVQVGYTIADVTSKPVLGLVVWRIAVKKSQPGFIAEQAE